MIIDTNTLATVPVGLGENLLDSLWLLFRAIWPYALGVVLFRVIRAIVTKARRL